ncbi:xanthine dehydrogenase family protein molybdopterin-binding subunit [Rhodococcus sp. CSLK01-03]|uniref:Xanthine dehydrogenase family protein molybdopterin-binding subunit n=1 Tax=Rhodococcus indonesiensis TaxID=3055869 RepID=A0ABT7RLJ3_9NOCA|nr:xanthine dehydrogenase family protein molybdopterin-binding subunit [Rhodococcus indonesiensis]MDM7488508.1 xanthine dehydrogenase family protein molybdopterin-binding subunit [Rhodococcus indonesiensis]
MTPSAQRPIGTSTARVDGPLKVAGAAPYAYEHPFDDPAYLVPITATVARGTVTRVETAAAQALPGVLAVLTPWSAPRLADTSEAEYAVLQDPAVAFRGQIVAAVVAETPEIARHASELVQVEYESAPHDVVFRPDHPRSYAPEQANGGYPTDAEQGDAAAAEVAERDGVVVDGWYSTPEEHNNPLEPHTVVALWSRGSLTLYDSTQSPHGVVSTLAPVLGLRPEQMRVVSPYVGGGFGSKGAPHAHDVVAAMAARLLPGRAVKFAVSRQDMFGYVGYRPPTVSHVRLVASREGRLEAVVHEAFSQSSHVREYAEQTAVSSRGMYAAPYRRTSHRIVALDVPAPYWMRAPGEAPGMFAGEVAMDELAVACGLDPIELRVRNDPPADPESGRPWSSRRLVECLREGARVFGWDPADRTPGTRRDGRWLVGTGVAAASYPHLLNPGTEVKIRHDGDGRYTVRTGAADIGTGAWTALALIAADALGCGPEDIHLEIGDSALPNATVAGGSSGTSSWGTAIVAAAHAFRKRHGDRPEPGAEASATAEENPALEHYRIQSFGAHFAEVRVDVDTGEIRVPRMHGVFSVGRVVNPRTARSQLIGGMCFGISMALHEESIRDARTGHVVNHDLAEYHIPTHADIGDVDATWLDEDDLHATPMGSRGVGEIGIVGSAAAVVNALWHATGARVRRLPAHLEDVLAHLPDSAAGE